MKKNSLLVIFFVLVAIWYSITYFVPYNVLANSIGIVDLGRNHSWPLAFFLMDALALVLTVLYVIIMVHYGKKKQYYWILLGILLVFPLRAVMATLFDLVLSPVVPY